MNEELERILGEALDLLEQGIGVEAIVARYPAHAAELRPFLLTATQLARLATLLERLTGRFRFVIIELPDLGRMPEGRSVLGVVDAVQLVVRLGFSTKLEVQESMAAIATSGVRLLGAIAQSERGPADMAL